jgi:hypothetical protein
MFQINLSMYTNARSPTHYYTLATPSERYLPIKNNTHKYEYALIHKHGHTFKLLSSLWKIAHMLSYLCKDGYHYYTAYTFQMFKRVDVISRRRQLTSAITVFATCGKKEREPLKRESLATTLYNLKSPILCSTFTLSELNVALILRRSSGGR